jgi:protein-disulfide isomerase
MLAAAIIVAYVAWGGRRPPPPPEPPLPKDPVSLEGAAFAGAPDARAVLIEYSDFQCPYCGKFAREILPEVKQKYVATGKVLFAFRNFPLDAMHPFARKAAVSAVCAARQGKFWEMHDQLFHAPSKLDDSIIAAAAMSVPLAEPAFTACLSGDAVAAVQSDMDAGKALHVAGTPALFVGLKQPDGRVKILVRLKGAQPAAEIGAVIDKMLAKAATN